jgi:hypothetical protein
MVTSPDALQKFRERHLPLLPDFKDMPPAKLHQLIKDTTGLELSPKSKLRPHQLNGLAFALYVKRGLLLFDMQLGKTLIALVWAEHLKACGFWEGTGLIIAHAPVGLDIWEAQLAQHCDLTGIAVRTNWEDFVNAIEAAPDFIIMTWSGLQAIFTEKRLSRKKVPKLYADKPALAMAAEFFSLCIIDEIDRVQDPFGLWFNLAAQITARCDFRLGLTGTLVGRDVYKIWGPCFLIDSGEAFGTNFLFFKEAYGKKVWNYARKIDEPVFDKTYMPIVQQKLGSFSLSYKRSETGSDVVEQRGSIDLRMRGEQKKFYNEAIKGFIATGLDDRVAIGHIHMRLRQISAGYLPFEDTSGTKRLLRFKDDVKFEWFRDWLERFDGLPTIIFHQYTYTGELLVRELDKAKVKHGWLHGATKDSSAMVADFQAGRSSVMVAQNQKGSASLMLNRADYVLFFEGPSDARTRAQAEARPKNDRRTRPLFIDDIICSPVDRQVLEHVQDGKDVLRMVTAGAIRKLLV